MYVFLCIYAYHIYRMGHVTCTNQSHTHAALGERVSKKSQGKEKMSERERERERERETKCVCLCVCVCVCVCVRERERDSERDRERERDTTRKASTKIRTNAKAKKKDRSQVSPQNLGFQVSKYIGVSNFVIYIELRLSNPRKT